jgi:ATP-dependent Clp protease ATP-binding subunit ClpC
MTLRLTIPVYVDHQRDKGGKARFRVQPLFVTDSGLEESDPREDRAMTRLGEKLRRRLAELMTSENHHALLPWTFCPAVSGHSLRLRIELRQKSFEGGFFVAVFEGAGRRLALLPCGGLSFEWPAGAQLEAETRRVLTTHLRKLEKDADDDFDPKEWLCGSQPHLSHLTLTLSGNQRIASKKPAFLSLGQEESMDGAKELQKTARCLNSLYPQDLHHALLREDEMRALMAWFGSRTTHPPMVLLVGRPKSGKTALIHECVRRRIESPESGARRGQFWLVAPQRVISGMSYLGQWEERWTAMLSEMRKQRHILVLDDLPGLFEAGKSSGSDLTLGHVLKARQEHEPVSILAEATPEAWGRLRELDRAFASLFQVIHVRETGDDATLRILIRTLQDLEAKTSTRLAPEVLPLTMRLQQRFGRARAFPGKGVEMLQALATSFADCFGDEAKPQLDCVEPSQVLEWFAQRNGIRLTMIDATQKLTAASLREFFATRIMGQQEAVKAMIDTVLMARAEVQDARRPLGTLLFLGPTGVGKTECARALAEFVFGSEERMLRFDLNEYTGADASLRLIGGPGQSGLLTSRVRRQPFSLLLFDEVEKAHPDVFDLLLQVLGEGRLTDAQGQTADFCNCLVILTSNIGAQNARRRLGFEESNVEDRSVYREAAEKFFRPEFFNRLDRIVPFHELRREDIEHLSGVLATRALARQGLRDRRVEVLLDAACVRFLAQRGYDRENGARALRRAVETHLVEPLAAALMSLPSAKALRVRVTLEGEQLHFEPEMHRQAAPCLELPVCLSRDELLDHLDEAHATLDAAATKLDAWQLEDGLNPLRAWYFQLRDEITRLRHQLEKAENLIEWNEKARKAAAVSRKLQTNAEPLDDHFRVMPREVLETLLETLLAADSASQRVTDLLKRAHPMAQSTMTTLRLIWQSRRVLSLCDENAAVPETFTLRGHVGPWWSKASFFDLRRDDDCLILEGHGLNAMVSATLGTRAEFAAQTTFPTITADELPPPPPEIIRIHSSGMIIDLRTGLCVDAEEGERLEFALALRFGA